MQTTTLSFSNMHDHGALFTNVLRARHESFIVHRKWDLPQAEGMEFDQYDTPAARYSVVLRDGEVVGGARVEDDDTQPRRNRRPDPLQREFEARRVDVGVHRQHRRQPGPPRMGLGASLRPDGHDQRHDLALAACGARCVKGLL